jgi:hypothetical protein
VAAAVLAGLERDETPDSLRRLIDGAGVRYDTEFMPNAMLRYASGVLRAAAGNHATAIEELRSCAFDHPAYGGGNPAMFPWRSSTALSLAVLSRRSEAQALAADEVQRAQSFGASRAIGIALRAQALVGSPRQRSAGLAAALEVLTDSPARLEHARVLVDLGATHRAAGQRTAAREPLEHGLTLAAHCGARALERRARSELAAIGVRPRGVGRAGPDSLPASERRVAELAATGGTNREIAQTLFVTEKTVEESTPANNQTPRTQPEDRDVDATQLPHPPAQIARPPAPPTHPARPTDTTLQDATTGSGAGHQHAAKPGTPRLAPGSIRSLGIRSPPATHSAAPPAATGPPPSDAYSHAPSTPPRTPQQTEPTAPSPQPC